MTAIEKSELIFTTEPGKRERKKRRMLFFIFFWSAKGKDLLCVIIASSKIVKAVDS